jgi:Ice-binding-like
LRSRTARERSLSITLSGARRREQKDTGELPRSLAPQRLDRSKDSSTAGSSCSRQGTEFWQVAGITTLGTTSEFKGIILDQTAITMNTGAKLDGMALEQTAVTLDSNTVNSRAVSTLVNSFYAIESSNDPNDNTCEVGVDGQRFEAFAGSASELRAAACLAAERSERRVSRGP